MVNNLWVERYLSPNSIHWDLSPGHHPPSLSLALLLLSPHNPITVVFHHWGTEHTSQNQWVTHQATDLHPPPGFCSRQPFSKAMPSQLVHSPRLGTPPNPRTLLPSRPRPHKPEQVSDLHLVAEPYLSLDSLHLNPYLGQFHSRSVLALLLLGPATKSSWLPPLRPRPHQ